MTQWNGRCGRLPFCGHYLQCCCRVVGRVLPCCTAMFLLRACHVTAAMPLRRSRIFGNGMSSPLPATMVCPSRPTCVAMSKLRDLFDRRSVLQNSSIHRATIRDAKLLSCTSQAGLRLGARPCVAANVAVTSGLRLSEWLASGLSTLHSGKCRHCTMRIDDTA